MNRQIDLFATFLKIGAFTFGGGYAMIPLIQQEVCDKKGWIDEDTLLDMIAISESTPGPVAINVATFVGYKTAGFWGAFCATLGVVLPSFIVILIVSSLLKHFYELRPVKYAFFGIKAGVLALLVKTFVGLYKKSKKNLLTYAVIIMGFVGVLIFNVDAVYVIICSGFLGYLFTFLLNRRNGV